MADLQAFTQFVRIGRQSDRTTACPFSAPDKNHASNANRWRDFATLPDGLAGGVSNPVSPFPTQHRTRGALYLVQGNKNFEPGTLTLPLVPENLKFVMDLFATTNDQLDYYTIEEYWTSSLTGGDIGRRLLGCIFTGWSLEASREQNTGLQIQINFFLNQEVAIPAGALPTFTPAPATPGIMKSLGVVIDLVKTTGAFNADIPAIRSISLNFSHNATVSDPRGAATGSLDRVWTRHSLGDPTLSVNARFRIDDDDYLNWPREEPLASFQLRVGFFNNAGTYNAIETITLVDGGGSQTIAVSDVSGLDDGDVVLIIIDDGRFTVGNVSAVTVGPDSFDIDDADCAFTAEQVAIYNCAMEIRVPRIELTQPGQKAANGTIEEVSHGFSAFLLAGETDLYSTKAYNDDNA